MKEKIVNILINELCYCYCDNCEYGNWDKYGDRHCDDCHRKYQNWKLSTDTAAQIAEQIIKEAIYNFEDLIDKINQIGNINPILPNELKEVLNNAK